jgi:hypothetical protein
MGIIGHSRNLYTDNKKNDEKISNFPAHLSISKYSSELEREYYNIVCWNRL